VKSDKFLGELVFGSREGGVAVVRVYRGDSMFTIIRVIAPAVTEEVSKVDCYDGDINGYILEATLKWSDLERDGVRWKPQAANRDLDAGQVGTF
jgi:hypothetical protein